MTNTTLQPGRVATYPALMSTSQNRLDTLPLGANRNRELFKLRASYFVELFPDELVIQEKQYLSLSTNFSFRLRKLCP
ncbi:MAG: hypothetical protein H6797_00335 [Candidatus Nomurabacteria bacterium]|nr:MAG: hypothetical protein H6797_00335 [Candidatus Nomurabacteria bacterium]